MLTIEDIRQNNSVVEILGGNPFEFDTHTPMDETEQGWFQFEDERPYTYLAADGCGGEFVLSKHKDEKDSAVWCISSDAQASRLGNNLREALEHILTIPFWTDVAHQDLQVMMKRYEDGLNGIAEYNKKWLEERTQVASALGLMISHTHVDRLHQSLAIGVQEKVRVGSDIALNGFSNNWDE